MVRNRQACHQYYLCPINYHNRKLKHVPLITGGGGLISRHTVPCLQEKDRPVTRREIVNAEPEYFG